MALKFLIMFLVQGLALLIFVGPTKRPDLIDSLIFLGVLVVWTTSTIWSLA